ncbi:four helix bundle protein [Rhodohalobacter barkolensis]|uniref:Four helix bundle protein n=1 Tax=Rhodohalobacter barkolensis TaxID=2053187 RepID=A0A2N0VG72_9BACT|nr:four helix bundle protein [Rhodohalobacter barkolensis]PKD43192.1 four helix bundle protein [Rhodohalobacter barkolensis]
MKVERFEDLEIWQLARELCKDVYQITNFGAFAKDFKLRNQIRGSSGSIMDNIAEGFERGGNKEFIQFLSIAKGSCGETRSQLYRSFDYEYITETEFETLVNKAVFISKKISSLMNYLSKSDLRGSKFKQ